MDPSVLSALDGLLGAGGAGAIVVAFIARAKDRKTLQLERDKITLEREKIDLEERAADVAGLKTLAAELRIDLNRVRNDLTLTQDDLAAEQDKTDRQAVRLNEQRADINRLDADLKSAWDLVITAAAHIRAREDWTQENLQPRPPTLPQVPPTIVHLVFPDAPHPREPPPEQ